MAEQINIGGRLHSTETGNVVAGANEILDDNKGKKQSVINQETDAALGDRYTKNQTYNKTEVEHMISPNPDYKVYDTYADMVSETTHPDGAIYRVSNYDGTQVDATSFAEYAWNGTTYKLLAVKSQIGEVFDISVYNNAVYNDLADALGTNGANVPVGVRRGGMSVKFKQLVTPASYTVVKTEGLDSQPTGTEIFSDPDIDSGTYNASQLSAFSTLPESTGAGNAVTYWMEVAGDTTTYTSWVITMVQSSDNKYVQYRYECDDLSGFDKIYNWRKIYDSIINYRSYATTAGTLLNATYGENLFELGKPKTRVVLRVSYNATVNVALFTSVDGTSVSRTENAISDNSYIEVLSPSSTPIKYIGIQILAADTVNGTATIYEVSEDNEDYKIYKESLNASSILNLKNWISVHGSNCAVKMPLSRVYNDSKIYFFVNYPVDVTAAGYLFKSDGTYTTFIDLETNKVNIIDNPYTSDGSYYLQTSIKGSNTVDGILTLCEIDKDNVLLKQTEYIKNYLSGEINSNAIAINSINSYIDEHIKTAIDPKLFVLKDESYSTTENTEFYNQTDKFTILNGVSKLNIKCEYPVNVPIIIYVYKQDGLNFIKEGTWVTNEYITINTPWVDSNIYSVVCKINSSDTVTGSLKIQQFTDDNADLQDFEIQNNAQSIISQRKAQSKAGVGCSTVLDRLQLSKKYYSSIYLFIDYPIDTDAYIYLYQENGTTYTNIGKFKTNRLLELTNPYPNDGVYSVGILIQAANTVDGFVNVLEIDRYTVFVKESNYLQSQINSINADMLSYSYPVLFINGDSFEYTHEYTSETNNYTATYNFRIPKGIYTKFLVTNTNAEQWVGGSIIVSGDSVNKTLDFTTNQPIFTSFDFDVTSVNVRYFNFLPGTVTFTVNVLGLSNEIISSNNRLRLSDCYRHWLDGEKFPIAFLGDSTTDGVYTTGYVAHETQDLAAYKTAHPEDTRTDEQLIQSGIVYGYADYINPNAYPDILEHLLKAELGVNALRIYNAGYGGLSAEQAANKLAKMFGHVYSDTKMVGIVLGINDRQLGGATENGYYNSLITSFENIVQYFLGKDIIPFMVTNQTAVQSGDRSNTAHDYNVMMQNYVQRICNNAKYDIARKYNLEVIDLNSFTDMFLNCSNKNYWSITEALHFGDAGHVAEAGYLFTKLINRINFSGSVNKVYYGLLNGASKTEVIGSSKYLATNDKFKVQYNYTKSDSDNKLIYDIYIFNDSVGGAYNLMYYTPTVSGYIVIDNDTSNPISITEDGQNLGTLDVGLHRLQVYTGESTTVAFKGFLLEQQN